MKAVESEVEINGITIYYRSYGDGDPLLLIQGLGGIAIGGGIDSWNRWPSISG